MSHPTGNLVSTPEGPRRPPILTLTPEQQRVLAAAVAALHAGDLRLQGPPTRANLEAALIRIALAGKHVESLLDAIGESGS